MVSPDGSQLVAAGSPTQNPGLWLIDLKGNASTRLSSEGIGPLWSPDGRHVAFTSRGGLDITISSTVGPPEEKLLLHDNERKTVQDWSPDGRFLVYTRVNPQTKLDVWLLPLSDAKRTVPLLATAANERGARISPDGRWVAYNSDESGRSEVYIQEFPKLGSKRAVSTGGGAGPSWRRDGGELFYLSPSRTLMAVGLDFSKGMAFRPPTALFRASLAGDFADARNHYSAAPDGQAFLVNVIEETADHASITVMVNWRAALKPASATISRRDRPSLPAVARAN
jgi:Tol biopolymer transport system component